MNRIITVNCAGETIKKSSSFAGAAGSHNAVTLRFSFSPEWDGTTKKIIFYNALGGNPVYRLCTVDCLTPDASDSYDIPIPGEAMEFEGDMIVTVSGVTLAEGGGTAERIIRALNTTFNVGAASTPASDVEPAEPTPTQAEQLQGQIDHVLQSIVDAMNAAAAAHVSEVNAAGSAASASGSASVASGSATAAASSASAAAGSASAAATSESNVAASAVAAAGSASSASASATTASTKASEAAASATNAANSATTATTKANEAASSKTAAETAQAGAISAKNDSITAKTAAETARTGAESARDLAVTAKNDATTAKTGAQTAQGLSEGARDVSVSAKNDAVIAKTAAETAQGLAQTAKTGADTAKAGADTARTGAESARDTAITAKDNAVTAKNAAQSAQTAAETAKGQAETARTGAQTAATTAGNRALDSEAYGAGTRSGVAVTSGDPAYQNNAKYYKDQAGEIVGGDFATKTEAQGYATTAETNAKSYADTQIAAIPLVDISGKADKTYVDNKVKTDVPVGAKFTDTVTTVNGKTGAISKADIVALGIPAQDTVVDISGKVDKVAGKGLSTEDYTTAEKTKLAGVAANANNYTHPANHPASIITQDTSNRFVTDAEKTAWSGKANASHTHTKANITDFPTSMTPTAHKSSHATGGSDALTAADIGAASRTSGTATLAVASWVGTAAPYTYEVSIAGLTADDVLDVKAVEGMDKAAADLIKEAWGKAIGHFKPQTSAGKLTFYASEKPAVAIPIYWRLIK